MPGIPKKGNIKRWSSWTFWLYILLIFWFYQFHKKSVPILKILCGMSWIWSEISIIGINFFPKVKSWNLGKVNYIWTSLQKCRQASLKLLTITLSTWINIKWDMSLVFFILIFILIRLIIFSLYWSDYILSYMSRNIFIVYKWTNNSPYDIKRGSIFPLLEWLLTPI